MPSWRLPITAWIWIVALTSAVPVWGATPLALRAQRTTEQTDPDTQFKRLLEGVSLQGADVSDPDLTAAIRALLADLIQWIRTEVAVPETRLAQWEHEIEQDPMQFFLRYTELPSQEWLDRYHDLLRTLKSIHSTGYFEGRRIFFVQPPAPGEENPLLYLQLYVPQPPPPDAVILEIELHHRRIGVISPHFILLQHEEDRKAIQFFFELAHLLWHADQHPETLRKYLFQALTDEEQAQREPGRIRPPLGHAILEGFTDYLAYWTIRRLVESSDSLVRQRWQAQFEEEWQRARDRFRGFPLQEGPSIARRVENLIRTSHLEFGGYLHGRYGDSVLWSFLLGGLNGPLEDALGPERVDALNAIAEFAGAVDDPHGHINLFAMWLAVEFLEHGDFSAGAVVTVLATLRDWLTRLHDQISELPDDQESAIRHAELISRMDVDQMRDWAKALDAGRMSREALKTEIHRLLPDSLAELLPSSTVDPTFVRTRIEYDASASRSLANAL